MPEGIFSVRMKHALYTHCLKALALPPEKRANYGQMHYPCPNAADDPNKACYGGFPSAPATPTSKLPRTQVVLEGQKYHWFDLCHNLDRVACDHRLDNGAIKPDLVGLDDQSEPLWIIEVVDTSKPSSRVSEFARRQGIPMFVVMVTGMSINDEIIWTSNLGHGHLPRADILSAGTTCPRDTWPKDTLLRPDITNGDSPLPCIVCREPLNSFLHEDSHMAFEHGLVSEFVAYSDLDGNRRTYSNSSWALVSSGLAVGDRPPLQFNGVIKRAVDENEACRQDVRDFGPCLAEATHHGYCLMHLPPNFP